MFQLVAMNIYWKQSQRGVPWNQLKLENIEILYLLSALKEPVQTDYKKACYVMEQAWMSSLTHLLKISSTHFMAWKFFSIFWNTSENQSLPDFLRGHWRRPMPWNGLRVIWISSYLFCYLLKKIVYTTEKLLIEWNC